MILDNDFIENEKKKFTDIKAKPKEDFTGMKFGRLTVICRANDYHYSNGRDVSVKWHCICDCDEHNLVDVKHSHLKDGTSKSCGCCRRECGIKMIKNAQEACKKPLKDNPTLELNLTDDKHEPFGKFRCDNDDSVEVYFSMSDFDTIKDVCWHIEHTHNGYVRVRNKKSQSMHQLFGMKDADHINRNALDNRRENLDDKATRIDQSHNQKLRTDNTSGVKGVGYIKNYPTKPWKAELKHYGERVLFCYYETKQEAIIARLNAEMQYLDERAWQKELMVQYGLIQEEGA